MQEQVQKLFGAEPAAAPSSADLELVQLLKVYIACAIPLLR